ncbi:uncharacterized protein EV422DRAFT_517672 [Fimicolochytrium jonesii]|uniref:uncharacterized protein n=1 Tax=Fimicolochytrium jonesii TaxID=1396493 RepID=UPI0022FE105E|nr:uncharacterized protein EV422DRAFT_517672 [Fimicolochytrium jonesii]KAI8825156.1 hypothetical protein EV422DRAFT_517672 [Fimicolochytrium jonesii]
MVEMAARPHPAQADRRLPALQKKPLPTLPASQSSSITHTSSKVVGIPTSTSTSTPLSPSRISQTATVIASPTTPVSHTSHPCLSIVSFVTCVSAVDAHLPAELLVRIFAYLDVKSRCRALRTHRRWKDVMYCTPRLWTRLDWSNRFSLGGDKSVAEGARRTDTLLQFVFADSASAGRFTKLARLDLSCTDVDPSVFMDTPCIRLTLKDTLSHLVLNGCPNVDSGSLYNLRGLTALRALDLSHCESVDDAGLEVLSYYLPHLTHLNLSYLFRITERGIGRIFRMPAIVAVNLMGCYRIKQYPWAIVDGAKRTALPLRELQLGEDSRIQTRGFWLLWCTFSFSTARLISVCPFLETLRLNMVLFDLPANGLEILLNGCDHLKHLSLVIDRAAVPALCSVAPKLRSLESLEATVHIGVTGELLGTLVTANALPKLKALKFHSKHTTVFSDASLAALITAAPLLEYLELNGDDITAAGLQPVAKKIGPQLQSLLLHHVRIANASLRTIGRGSPALKELTMTDLQQLSRSNRLRHLVCDSTLRIRLRKIELASHAGFNDKDLATVPANCPNLQWIDFSFSFTYPRTGRAIADHCPGLLYLRLCKATPPPLHQVMGWANNSNAATTNQTANAQPTTPAANNANAAATNVVGASNSAASHSPPVLIPRPPRPRRSAHSSESVTILALKLAKQKRRRKSPPTFHASSPECRSLMYMTSSVVDTKSTFYAPRDSASSSRPPPPRRIARLRKLRVLDLTGNIGLTDWTLEAALSRLPALHTLFIDSCDSITRPALLHFADMMLPQLKRVHVRNCSSCRPAVGTASTTTTVPRIGIAAVAGGAAAAFAAEGQARDAPTPGVIGNSSAALAVEVVIDGARVWGRRFSEEG